jgi:hypothetical protein
MSSALNAPPPLPAPGSLLLALETNVRELQFDDVAINDAATYRRFTVRNTLSHRLTVSFASSSSCIRFQERNENFLGTEVVSASSMFDGFNVITEAIIEGGACIDVVAVFSAVPLNFPGITAPSAPAQLHAGEITLTGRPAGGVDPAYNFVTTLPFVAKVYLSSMVVHPTELQAFVGPGTTKVFDFKVTNPSSKPLSFVLRLQTMLPAFLELGLFEHDNAEQLKFGSKYQLEARGTQSFGFVVRGDASAAAVVAGQYNAVVQCDNLRDARNTTLISVAIVVTPQSHAELVSVSDSTLDFGDLHRGNSKVRVVTFFNPSVREDASVRMSKAHHNVKAEGSLLLMLDDVPVDEVTVPPLKNQRVAIRYTPAFSTDSDGQKVKFEVELEVLAEGRTQKVFLRAQATLFTSSITINVSKVSFGDCQIGQTKRFPLVIENMSPLEGMVMLQLRSKIIHVEGGTGAASAAGSREWCEELHLPAKGKATLTLSICPQRVNPTYRKQLRVTNMSNQRERFTIEIEANNMAPSEAKVHDALYSWECAMDTNVAPLVAVSNTPLIVPFHLRSKVQTSLALSFTLTCDEMTIFTLDVEPDAQLQFETAAAELAAMLRVADELALSIPSAAGFSPERTGQLREEVNALVQNHGKRVSSLSLEPLQKQTCYIRIMRTSDNLKFHSKEDGLNIQVEGIETRRFVRISYQLCASRFVIEQQRAKNFGEVSIGERRSTKFQLTNPSKVPLYFSAAKSRSVTASHLRIDGVPADKVVFFGFIGPHAKKDIDVTFVPGIKGNFSETILVSNLLDPTNTAQISIKAVVRKPETFDVCPGSWSFGEITAGDETPRATKLVVTNTSRSRREYRFRLDGNEKSFFKLEGAECRVSLDVEHSAARSGSVRKLEEQLDMLEKKLKIYVRKGKKDKADGAQRRIEVLRRALRGEEVDLAAGDDGFEMSELSGDESASIRGGAARKRYYHAEFLQMLTRDGVPLPPLNPGEQANLVLAMACVTAENGSLPLFQTTSLNLVFFEASDHELQKSVPLDMTLVSAAVTPSATKHAAVPATASSSHLVILPNPGTFFGWYGDTPVVSLHNALLHDPTTFRFCLTSTTDTVFVILEPVRCGGPIAGCFDARFHFSPRNGQIRGGEAVTVSVECTPKYIGPQRFFIPIKNLKNASEVRHLAVECNPTLEADDFDLETKLLDFGTLITPLFDARKVSLSALDLNPRNATNINTAKAFYIRNRASKPLTLLVRSNKPSQILLFEDSSENCPLENPVVVAPKASVRLYAKLVPSRQCDTMDARVVVGGILVEAIDVIADSYAVNSCATLKVQALIGSGVLRMLTSSAFDLGTLPSSEKSSVISVVLANPSRRLAVAFHATYSSNLLPELRTDTSGSLAPMQERRFNFVLKFGAAGLYNEWINFFNDSCDDKPLHVQITCLKQDGTVSMTPADLLYPIIPVERVEGEWRIATPLTISSQITNHSSRDYVLVANMSVPVAIETSASASASAPATSVRDASAADPSRSAWKQGGRMRIDARQTRKLEWTLFKAPELSAKDEEALANLQLVSFNTSAHVDIAQVTDEAALRLPSMFRSRSTQPIVGQCVLKPRIGLQFAMSEGAIEPQNIDVGILGLNKRFSEKITFVITNRSALVPLIISIECEPTVRFSLNRLTVEPRKAQSVEAQLDAMLLRQQGPFRISIFFVNASNHENEMCAVITGRYFNRMFRIGVADAAPSLEDQLPGGGGCGGGASGGSVTEKITLPTIRIGDLTPGLDTASEEDSSVLVDTKLTIASTDRAMQPFVECKVDPKLEGLLRLQMLSFDASTVVEQLQFSAVKSAEIVRLRLTLLKSNLGRLTAGFFGLRNVKALLATKFDDLVQAATVGGGGGGLTSTTEKNRLTSSTSTWLGSVRLTNDVTEDQEVQISGSLEAFTTFACEIPSSSKRLLLLKASKDGKLYSGKFTVTNSFSSHTVALSILCVFRTEDGGTSTVADSAAIVGSLVQPTVAVAPRQTSIEPKKSVTVAITIGSLRDVSFLDLCALILLDENVHCGYTALRLGAAPFDVVEPEADETEGVSPSERATRSPFDTTREGSGFACATVGDTLNSGFGASGSGSPRTMLLELTQCTPAAGEEGSYVFNAVCMKDGEQPALDIRLTNSSTSTAVEFVVVIMSQNPVPWITSANYSTLSRIKPGESLPLKFGVLTSETGSFVAHVAINVPSRPSETIFLKLACDVLTTAGAEGAIYDVLSTTGTITRLAPGSQPLYISAGSRYGDGVLKTNMVEIVNRSNFALEFTVNVVRPFRLQASQRRDAGAAALLANRLLPLDSSVAGSSGSFGGGGARLGVSPVPQSDFMTAMLPPNNNNSRSATVSPPVSTPTSATVNHSTVPVDPATLVDCRVSVCLQTHVAANAHQSSIVLEPKGKVRLVAAISVEKSHLPSDMQLSVEVDIFIKCRTVRDSQHAVRLTFSVLPASFRLTEPWPTFGPSSLVGKIAVAPGTDVDSLVALVESPVVTVTPVPDEDCFAVEILKDHLAPIAEARSAAVDSIAFEEHVTIFSRQDPSERLMVPISYLGSSSVSSPSSVLRPLLSSGVEIERRAHSFARRLACALASKEKELTAILTEVEDSSASSGGIGISRVSSATSADIQPSVLASSATGTSSSVLLVRSPSAPFLDDVDGSEALGLSELLASSGILHELQFLVDECAFFLSYRYSRTFVAVCHLLAAVVLSHRVIRAVRKRVVGPSSTKVPRQLEVLRILVGILEGLPFTDLGKF